MNKISIKLALAGAVIGLFIILTMTALSLDTGRKISEKSLGVIDNLLRSSFDFSIKNEVETVVSMIDSLNVFVDNGKLTKEEAEEIAYHMVREARYDSEGYFWGDEPDGTLRILYGNDAEGSNRYNMKDLKGNPFIQEIIDAGLSGGGFTDYWFAKKGEDTPLPKRGFSLQSEYFNLIIGTGNYIDDIDNQVVMFSDEISQTIQNSIRSKLIPVFIMFILVCVLAGFIGVFLAKGIIHTTQSLEEISQGDGDLTKEIHVGSKDEVKRLATAFNVFVFKLAEMIRDIITSLKVAQSSSEELVSSSEETTASVKQIGKNSDAIKDLSIQLNDQVGQVNSAFGLLGDEINSLDEQIETQVSAIEESTASIVEMTASINSVATRSQQKRTSVTELLGTTADGILQISNGKKSVDELTSSIQEILDITSLLNQIAEQTNILSMNAAIEAAHAGDAGKGFGVVADEIRKLAESSSSNASSIERTLRKNVELITDIETTTDNSIALFKKVDHVAKDTDEVFAEIIRAMEELSTGAKEINKAVISLQDISVGVRTNSKSMSNQLGHLNGASKNMKDVANLTINSVTEIQQGINQISDAMEFLNGSVTKIAGAIKEVETKVGFFKV